MLFAYTADEIRRAEQPLIDAQSEPDELMKSAAHAVFETAEAMLAWPDPVEPLSGSRKTLLLVGKGGNGGDALYAGAELALAGHPVDAWIAWGSAHEQALKAFTNAGGTVLEKAPVNPRDYRFAIDGLTGLGGAGTLDKEVEQVIGGLADWFAYVLAVDVPSGIDADTGVKGDAFVTADVTVTFGGWRYAHGLAPECGIQLLADPHLKSGESISDHLHPHTSKVTLFRAVAGQTPGPLPDSLNPLATGNEPRIEPGYGDDKYTGGVVGIRAGSNTYPGAAVLATAGAVHATPAMVRYAGPQALEVVRSRPEVVVTHKLEDAGRVQAWVFGPGVGTDTSADGELALLLGREEPLLIDADGLTLLTRDPELRELLRHRETVTVLTPHDGEFERLRDAEGIEAADRVSETRALASALNCTIVRKGRSTIIVDGREGTVCLVDAGNSWAATPGSGDVLAGVLGARVARVVAQWGSDSYLDLAQSVVVHALAAQLAAETPYGPAATHALAVAEAVPAATAKLNQLTHVPAGTQQKRR